MYIYFIFFYIYNIQSHLTIFSVYVEFYMIILKVIHIKNYTMNSNRMMYKKNFTKNMKQLTS